MEHVRDRSKAVLTADTEKLDGFYFPPDIAIANTIDILKSSGQAKGVVYYDIDDTLLKTERWMKWWINKSFKESDPNFKSVSLKQVQDSGGRYYQVPAYQEATHPLGKPFSEFFSSSIAKNEQLHSYINPHQGALDLQLALQDAGFVTGGYPTARPQDIGKITAGSLRYHGFTKAPVVNIDAYLGSPADAKVAFMKIYSTQYPRTTSRKSISYR